MSNPTNAPETPDSSDEAVAADLPARFEEALEQVRVAIAHCETAGIANDTLLAALMTELVPRLVDAYGLAGVASMWSRLAIDVSAVGGPAARIQ